jgi:hypothetical protein
MPRVEYLHTCMACPMILPFRLPHDRLPVIVPCPKVRQVTLADESLAFETHPIRHLRLEADRGLFEIGFMLEIRQFAALSAAERFTIHALVRLLRFNDDLVFPDLQDAGRLYFVESSDNRFVWATIPSHVIITSPFSPLDLHDQCMALDEPAAMRDSIERALQGCPQADADRLESRFRSFNTPDHSDIRRALKELVRLGIVREYIKLDRHRRHAVFNMRLVASTRSFILRGMIAAEDLLRRVNGTEITFAVDLSTAESPVKRMKSTSTGRRRKRNRAQFQFLYYSEREKARKAAMRAADYEQNGYLTAEQFADLRKLLDDPTTPSLVRETLTLILASVRCNPLTEIPEILSAKDKRHA